jgi:DNA topoisomerase II
MAKKIEERYKKLSHKDHILTRPESYIGSIETELKEMFIVENIEDFGEINFIKKLVHYNPAFIKLYDEILVNASDHYIRTDGKVKKIKINITEDSITIENDGPGIPIEIHKEHKIYVPELIFGHLLTGENYDDDEERMVGGRNGYGSKLTNIYSKRFDIECCDGVNKYCQTFHNNLSRKSTPKITKAKRQYTKISFNPDFERFKLEKITDEIQQIFLKRAVDIAVYCPKLKVYFNDKLIPVKNIKDYMKMYIGENELISEKINDDWEIGVARSEDEQFQQISMVNGIFTYDGGTHVAYISNRIVKAVAVQLRKKYKGFHINENAIKRNLFVFVNARIANPIFSTQTKEKLITNASNYRGIDVSNSFVKKVLESEIVDTIITFIEAREAAKLKNASSGKKYKVKVKKLNDANKAGTGESKNCLLFLTEGDSASSMVLSGIEKKDKDFYGIFPLRGKPLNVRDATMKKVTENVEIKNIINILGLEYGKKYTHTNDLRYGKVVLLSDADADGYHIKGLLINLFDAYWPELLELDFIYEFITPIVRATKGKTSKKYYYKLNDYKKFRDSEESNGYFFKYYKGLGTIEAVESKQFFKKLKKHLIPIKDSEDKDIIDLVFKSNRADERKQWLLNYKPDEKWDKFSEETTIDSFFNKEFIEFSMYDNIRSIPSVVDGLKPSQRKVLFTMFKKNITNEVKVSQFSGSVIDLGAYHHGPQSLEQTIVGMSQDFVGSNNINLLNPKGGFGTRLHGGSDSAAARYIFTNLNDSTRTIFKSDDMKILDYINEDGKLIEPRFYLPIIPMLLVNGATGIGTGYSTNIPQYNPKDLVKWYQNKLQKKQNRKELVPYCRGFTGEIVWDDIKEKYITKGIYKVDKNNIIITELPVGLWVNKYVDFLDKLVDNRVIKDYVNNCTDDEIEIIIAIPPNFDETLLKLQTDIKLTNMIAFNENGILHKYAKIEEILEEFYKLRYKYYGKRKEMLISEKQKEVKLVKNKGNFIQTVITDKINLKNRKKDDIEKDLEKLKIEKIEDSYSYCLNMSLISLSTEKLNELKKLFTSLKNELKEIKEKTVEELWLNDLDNITI